MEFLIPVYSFNRENRQSRIGTLFPTGGKGVKLVDSDHYIIAYGVVDVASKMENLNVAVIAANEFRPILCDGDNPIQAEIEDYWGEPHIVVKAFVLAENMYRIGNKEFFITFTPDNHAHICKIEEIKSCDYMISPDDLSCIAPSTGVGFMSSPTTITDTVYMGGRINEDKNPTITKEKTFMNFNTQNIFKDVKFGKE